MNERTDFGAWPPLIKEEVGGSSPLRSTHLAYGNSVIKSSSRAVGRPLAGHDEWIITALARIYQPKHDRARSRRLTTVLR